MNHDPDVFPTGSRPVLVRARGKQTLALVIRMLNHFKVPFSVLHDADSPYRKDGASNTAWGANEAITKEIGAAKSSGIRVLHRVSVPTFEFVHLPVAIDKDGYAKFASEKDKPWSMVAALGTNELAGMSVRQILNELISPKAPEPPFEGDVLAEVEKAVISWAQQHSPKDPRFFHANG
jgi:putative ATP-dependent endonuclease of OLD family